MRRWRRAVAHASPSLRHADGRSPKVRDARPDAHTDPETPDDHGDSPASATEVALLQPIEGTLEDEQDVDYFRFQPVEGQRFRVEVVPLEGEPPRVCVYNREGRATTGRSEDCSVFRGGDAVSFEWTASSPYDFYLAISGGAGVLTYTLLITPAEE